MAAWAGKVAWVVGSWPALLLAFQMPRSFLKFLEMPSAYLKQTGLKPINLDRLFIRQQCVKRQGRIGKETKSEPGNTDMQVQCERIKNQRDGRGVRALGHKRKKGGNSKRVGIAVVARDREVAATYCLPG